MDNMWGKHTLIMFTDGSVPYILDPVPCLYDATCNGVCPMGYFFLERALAMALQTALFFAIWVVQNQTLRKAQWKNVCGCTYLGHITHNMPLPQVFDDHLFVIFSQSLALQSQNIRTPGRLYRGAVQRIDAKSYYPRLMTSKKYTTIVCRFTKDQRTPVLSVASSSVNTSI